MRVVVLCFGDVLPESKRVLLARTAFPRLLAQLLGNADDGTVSAAAEVVVALCGSRDISEVCSALCEAGCVPTLVRSIASRSAEVRYRCLRAAVNLAGGDGAWDVECLLQPLRLSDSCECAVTVEAAFIAGGVVPCLVQTMQSDDARLREEAVKVLVNLSLGHGTAQTALSVFVVDHCVDVQKRRNRLLLRVVFYYRLCRLPMQLTTP